MIMLLVEFWISQIIQLWNLGKNSYEGRMQNQDSICVGEKF